MTETPKELTPRSYAVTLEVALRLADMPMGISSRDETVILKRQVSLPFMPFPGLVIDPMGVEFQVGEIWCDYDGGSIECHESEYQQLGLKDNLEAQDRLKERIDLYESAGFSRQPKII